MITFNLSKMNAVQLAKLYKLCIMLNRMDDVDAVYFAGVANCGVHEFCQEIANA